MFTKIKNYIKQRREIRRLLSPKCDWNKEANMREIGKQLGNAFANSGIKLN